MMKYSKNIIYGIISLEDLMKQKVFNTEEIFFLNLDEELNFLAKSAGFEFEITPLSLYEEASISMYVMKIAQELLEDPAYLDLVQNLEYPDVLPDGEVNIRPLNLKKMTDLRYAISFLPQSFASLVDNIAFFNKTVTKITKNGQRVAVKNPDNSESPIFINTFLDFVKYVKGKNVHLQRILEDLYIQYSDWEKNTSVDPVDVKN